MAWWRSDSNKPKPIPHVAAPIKTRTFATTPLGRGYRGEQIPNNPSSWCVKQFGLGPVTYLRNATHRAPYKLTVKGGKIHDAHGLFDTSDAQSLHNQGDPRAIFVMSKTGDLYAAKQHKRCEFHHSSFLQGMSVAAAGELVVDDGVLSTITNQSGHYRPPYNLVEQVFEELADDHYTFCSATGNVSVPIHHGDGTVTNTSLPDHCVTRDYVD